MLFFANVSLPSWVCQLGGHHLAMHLDFPIGSTLHITMSEGISVVRVHPHVGISVGRYFVDISGVRKWGKPSGSLT